MQQRSRVPTVKDLVLVGGGHAHVSVLRRFGMQPIPGVRITLIARDVHTPYSGMLPGHVAGHYDFDACHIDLAPLARFAGARLYHAEVDGLDPAAGEVRVRGRPAVPFDLLSINIGSRPQTAGCIGADTHALAVKPIDAWLQHWQVVQQRVLASAGLFRLVVVGGGAGGVEMALATQYRLQGLLAAHGDDPARLQVVLVSADREVLANHNAGVRRRFERILGERAITLHNDCRVTEVSAHGIVIDGRAPLAADAVLWVTHAAAPAWPGEAGLAVDADGFIRVDPTLRSLSHGKVFAAGDVASLPEPRPKSGVFAVRQGPVLADNLRRALLGRALRRYRPQRDFLGLISTGDRYAVASRGRWSAEGRWLWTAKDWIDRRFMARFNELPAMPMAAPPLPPDGVADRAAIETLSADPMRCGGCGAKVGASVLARVMQSLPTRDEHCLLIGRDAPDDAAVFEVPEGQLLVQSIDHFRAFIDDPFLFGRIAANHALGDLYAMGARPHSALALATVPHGIERVVEQNLRELMLGAVQVLDAAGAVLAGGHSGEGEELAFGLSVNGLVEADALLRKSGLQPGDVLVLGKALGTGTLLAADMRGRARGRWLEAALASMQQSNRDATDCLRRHAARACTDITGFGLVGHLLEMLQAGSVDAVLDLAATPLLDGAVESVAAGILSSLQPHNLRLRRAVTAVDQFVDDPRFALLFDPQTAGGLLAGVPAERAVDCVAELRRLGYSDAAAIGKVVARRGEAAQIVLR